MVCSSTLTDTNIGEIIVLSSSHHHHHHHHRSSWSCLYSNLWQSARAI